MMTVNKPKIARPVVWIGFSIAAAVVVVLIITVPILTANGGTIPGMTTKYGVPAGSYMSQNASTDMLDKNWTSIPKQTIYNPWFYFNPIKGKELFISPQNWTQFAYGASALMVLNNPAWKNKGLEFGTALVLVNSNYAGTDGTVIFAPGPNIWWSTDSPYVIVCDLKNFNITAAKLYFEMKYV